MANSRELNKDIKQLSRVKTWQLLILLILMSVVSLTLLRLNNIEMIQHRDTVLNADKAGDDGATYNALINLQHYVAGHMNADTGPFFLEASYKKDFAGAYREAANYHDPNGNVNVRADKVCAPQFTQYSQAYTDCFAAQLKKYPAAPNPAETIKIPNSSLYQHDFVSPRWSPDFAGLSVLVCFVIAFIIIARLVTLGILYVVLRWRYRQV